MAERNLDLNERVEASRDPHRVAPPIKFELADIKDHFDQSLDRIKNQYEVADSLKQDGKEDDCKNIWRSQVVFLEGILDFYLHEMSKYCLYNLFKRRNAIAHQLDRDHASAEQTDITKEFVEERASEVVAIVEAIHKIAVEKG